MSHQCANCDCDAEDVESLVDRIMEADESFLHILEDVCSEFGYKLGQEIVVNQKTHEFVINDPEISEESRVDLSLKIQDAIQLYRMNIKVSPGFQTLKEGYQKVTFQ